MLEDLLCWAALSARPPRKIGTFLDETSTCTTAGRSENSVVTHLGPQAVESRWFQGRFLAPRRQLTKPPTHHAKQQLPGRQLPNPPTSPLSHQ